jgi:hypothetical protein
LVSVDADPLDLGFRVGERFLRGVASSEKLSDADELLGRYHGSDPMLARLWWRIVFGLVCAACASDDVSS